MTDNGTADVFGDIGRTLGNLFNSGIYMLLTGMYQVFFNVASAQLFENETIKNFYGRVQLIIGVFMIFKLSISILQGIMNPDKFTNPKEGFGNVITRIIISLALLTVLMPINIPNVQNANSYEKYINNNGLLFGTLYSLQDRILSNNTLGRLILGTTDNSTNDSTATDQSGMTEAELKNEKLKKSSRIFASTILKGFLRINMLPEDVRESDDESNPKNWYCGDHIGDDEKTIINAYNDLDVDPSTLLSDTVLKAKCDLNQSIGGAIGNFFNIRGDAKYLFAFNWIVSLIVGGIFLFILVGFTVDIAIRSIKLAILRLIAPIPVISYIEPSSSKNGGMFSSWVKALTSTYLDLFLRLAIVYFVIFLIQDMIVNGIIIDEPGGIVGIISCIFIWIGLFFFAKMAPKFIKDALGIKGTGMSNVGLSGILGGAATFVGGGGAKGALASTLSSMNASATAAGQGKQAPPAWSTGADLAAQIKTGDPKAKGGIMNSINDRLMRDAGINRARKLYGVTANGIAQAKDHMFKANDEVSKLQDYYNRMTQGNLTADEVAEIGRAGGLDANGNVTNAYRQSKFDELGAAQTKAAKAKSHYEDAKKFGDSHRVTPSFEDEHRWSLRERVGLGDAPRSREDYKANSGRYSAHQTFHDRVSGSPDKWDVAGSNRVDNRWSPDKYRSTDTNDQHENPHADIGTPRA